jgi:protein SCO1
MYKYLLGSIILFIGACTNQKEAKQPLPYYTSADFTPQWLTVKEAEQKKIHQIPSFAFINQLGDTITEKTVTDKIYVANFFFTSCPGICKRLTNNVMLVQQAFPNDRDIVILSHSVAPETDSISRLQQYAQQYKINQSQWHLLTGQRSSLYDIARRSYFADEDLGKVQAENDFLHTENVLLIDKQRRIRGVYKGTSETDIRNLIADIKLLQSEG